jgi:hypothetical protein
VASGDVLHEIDLNVPRDATVALVGQSVKAVDARESAAAVLRSGPRCRLFDGQTSAVFVRDLRRQLSLEPDVVLSPQHREQHRLRRLLARARRASSAPPGRVRGRVRGRVAEVTRGSASGVRCFEANGRYRDRTGAVEERARDLDEHRRSTRSQANGGSARTSDARSQTLVTAHRLSTIEADHRRAARRRDRRDRNHAELIAHRGYY